MHWAQNNQTKLKVAHLSFVWSDDLDDDELVIHKEVHPNEYLTKFKAESYQGLIGAASNDDLHHAGKVVILPASIMGSPRWYVEQ